MNVIDIIKRLGINAKKASVKLTNVHNEKKNEALDILKQNLKKFSSEIIDINKKDIENAYFSNNDDITDFYLMSQCQSGILSASTFALWVSYISINYNKNNIIYPP